MESVHLINIEKLKKDFPILDKKINDKPLTYLDSGATSLTPKQVVDAVNEYYEEYNANIHRALHTLGEKATEEYELAHRKVAKFINAGFEEIIFTKNTTESLNLLAYSLTKDLKKGDEIVISEMEHHSNLVPWQQLAKEKKLKLKYIKVKDGRLIDIGKVITDKTKIVSVTHVSNVLGTINDVKEIGKIAHSKGALMVVDGAQSVPHMKVDVKELDCEFLGFSITKDTPLLIKDENGKVKFINIGDLINKYKENIVKFSVLTLDEVQNVVFKPILGYLSHKTSEIYKIKYTGGEVKTTGSHSVFVFNEDGEITERKVIDLKEGNTFVTFCGDLDSLKIEKNEFLEVDKFLTENEKRYSHIKIPDKVPLNNELLRLFGIFVAEGSASVTSNGGKGNAYIVGFTFNINEKEVIEKTKEIMKNLFGLEVSAERYKRKSTIDLHYYSKPLTYLFKKLFGTGARNKKIPDFLFHLDKAKIIEFIKGYAGDAYVTDKIVFTTTSYKLAQQLCWLFRSKNINVNINGEYSQPDRYLGKSFIRGGEKWYLTINIDDNPISKRKTKINLQPESRRIPYVWVERLIKDLNLKLPYPKEKFRDVYNLMNYKKESIGKINVKGFLDWVYLQNVNLKEKILINDIPHLLKSPIGIAKIKKIEKIPYNDYIYDISVENERFFGGSSPILLHNSGHKMLGPTGIGVLYGKGRLLEKMKPFLYGGDMISEVKFENSKWNELPWKFEAGTPAIAEGIGLGKAAEYLSSIGMDNIKEYEEFLIGHAMEKLNKIKNVEVYGPKNVKDRSGVISFNIKGVHSHDVSAILDRDGIAVRGGHMCAMPLVTEVLKVNSVCRASFYFYNTKEDVDKLVDGIMKVKEIFKI